MIAKSSEMSRIICVDFFFKKLIARKIFRRDIYRSHPTIKVAQYYYFLHAWRLAFGAQGHDIFSFSLEFSRDSLGPTPYKQLCQIRKFYWMFWTTSLDCIDSLLKSHKYNLSQKAWYTLSIFKIVFRNKSYFQERRKNVCGRPGGREIIFLCWLNCEACQAIQHAFPKSSLVH